MHIFALALYMLSTSVAIADGPSFFDSFDSMDRKRWYISNGWSNGAHQNCVWSSDNIRLANSTVELLLTDVRRGEHPFSCGELQSNAFHSYGTFEVRMKPAARNNGIVSAFFTFTGPPHGRPHDEIDLEFVARRERSVDATHHAKSKSFVAPVPLDFDPRSGFHDYAVHWTPDRLTWYANGKIIRQVTRTENEPYPTTAQKIYISLWSGSSTLNDWLGRFDYPGTTLVASYDYIAYTKLGEDCQFPQSIVCKIGKDALNAK